MSCGICTYHLSLRIAVEPGQELDAFKHARLSSAAVTEFVGGLEQYGYAPESQSGERRTLDKPVGLSHVEVAMDDTEIAFTAAGGDEDAVREALQDASELPADAVDEEPCLLKSS